ncbi:MAG: hypothetical protein IIY29_06495 [Firmicutes bacterium]|nr:hypothetical protein [Bacillota bacterium]
MDKSAENRMPVREDPGPVKIGTLCSDCTNPEEKVMQSYVFDLGNIIRLGMYEKARISAEVLCEQGRDPAEIAGEIVFPAAREALGQYEKGIVNKAHAVKSLEAASIAIDVLKREMKDFSTVLQPGVSVVSFGKEDSWETKLLRASLECCGFDAERGEPEQSETVFVEIAPDAVPQAKTFLEDLQAKGSFQKVIAFGKYRKIAEDLKIDAELNCTDPVFGGIIKFKQLSEKG